MPIELDFKFNFIGRGIKNAVIKKIKILMALSKVIAFFVLFEFHEIMFGGKMQCAGILYLMVDASNIFWG